jgi:hypothetical protein
MKRYLFLVGAAIAALFISGCGSPPKAADPPPDPRESIATAVATCATAIERIATTANGDAASKVAAVGAIERMCGQGGVAMQYAAAPAPQQTQGVGAMLWSAALQTADLVLRGYGIKTQRDVSITASNNAAATTIAGYNAFGNIAASGFASNAQIASNIQAPAPNYNVSGNANFGAGAFTLATTTTTTTNTNSGNTTRTCNGGQAGNSGGTTGSAGGAGGPATC